MRTGRGLKAVFTAGFVLLICAAASLPFFFESPSMFYKFGMNKELLRLGKIFGIVAGMFMIFQPVLSGRLFLLDRVFGQDKLLIYHRWLALAVLCIAMLHPFFILWAEGFVFFPFELRYWPAFLGMGLLVLIGAMILVSFFRPHLKMTWGTWLIGHRILAPVIFGCFFLHVLKVSKPFETGLPNMLLIVTALSMILLLVRQWVLRPLLSKHRFKVVSVTAAAEKIWALELEPLSGSMFKFLPGQFAYITPVDGDVPCQEHPFTIASAPVPDNSGRLQFVIRAGGDFTSRIPRLAKDGTVLVDGPYGRFSQQLLPQDSPLVMIAGGIGITPMLSMLRDMASSGDSRKITLIWSNRTRGQVVFKNEMTILARRLDLEIHYLYTRHQDTSGRSGRLDLETLSALLTNVGRNTPIFLCGPPPMVAGVKKMLKISGFSLCRVYTESFVL